MWQSTPVAVDEQTVVIGSITVPASTSNLATLRDCVVAWATEVGARRSDADAFRLAVSELATNVIEHSDSPIVTVVFAKSASSWLMDVSDAPGAGELKALALPAPTQPTGRGLVIVTAVMDTVARIEHGGSVHLRCSKFIA